MPLAPDHRHIEVSRGNDGSCAVTLNRYLYANANSLAYADPDGRSAQLVAGMRVTDAFSSERVVTRDFGAERAAEYEQWLHKQGLSPASDADAVASPADLYDPETVQFLSPLVQARLGFGTVDVAGAFRQVLVGTAKVVASTVCDLSVCATARSPGHIAVTGATRGLTGHSPK